MGFTQILIPVIALAFLLFFSAFFSGAEIAFMSLSDLRIRQLTDQKKRNARIVQRLKSDPQRLLITVLIGNNLANVGASSFVTAVIIKALQDMNLSSFNSIGIGATTGLVTLLILIFGEIAPKSYCITNASNVALAIAPFIQFFQWLFKPFAWFLILITRIPSRTYFSKRYPLVTEDEVRTIVKMGEEAGSIQQEEKEMIHNVFELDKTDVSSIMTPRLDMFVLDSKNSVNDAIEKTRDKVYSRIPVFEGNIDKVTGIAYAKDILLAGLSGKGEDPLSSIVKPAIFIPENMMINILLEHFKKKKTHIAIAVDEHGGIAGLVTIEDVLEELVGEIYDETDKPEKLVIQVNADSYRIMAKINIGDLNEMLDLELEENELYDTLSGLILFQLSEIPKEGEVVRVDNISLKVNKLEEHRIVEVLLRKEPNKDDPPLQDKIAD